MVRPDMKRHIQDTLARALRMVAEQDGDTNICAGYTANLDLIATLDSPILADLADKVRPDQILAKLDDPPMVVREPADLLAGLWLQMEEQKGGEWPLQNLETFRWMREVLPVRPGVGGTGIQAACALAYLGLRPLLNVPWRDQELLDLLPARVQVAANGQVLPADDPRVVDADHETTFHFILEYVKGATWHLGGRSVVATRTDRFIVPFDPDEREFRIDDTFRSASLGLPGPKWLLATGFNVPNRRATVIAAIEQAAAHIKAFQHEPQSNVHVELGELHDAEIRREIRNRLFGLVTSVGFNENELGVLAEDLGFQRPQLADLPAVVALCTHIAETYTLARLNVHTAAYTLVLSRFDPESERMALVLGCATAAYRAWQGSFASLGDLGMEVANLELHPEGINAAESLPDWTGTANGGDSGYHVVCVPAFCCPQQRQAVGLGDTYTAGVLAAHACSQTRVK